jgi:hypothetical protein
MLVRTLSIRIASGQNPLGQNLYLATVYLMETSMVADVGVPDFGKWFALCKIGVGDNCLGTLAKLSCPGFCTLSGAVYSNTERLVR